MDWSDPWAADHDPDDLHAPARPTPAVTSASAKANTLFALNNVWDSPWGRSTEDVGYGGWASEVGTTARVGDIVGKEAVWDDLPDVKDDDDKNAWGVIEDVEEHKKSETSDSATTIQPDDAPAHSPVESAHVLHPDDDLSTRPSISPSDVSHNEGPAESPRTSFEEERAAGKAPAAEEEQTTTGEAVEDEEDVEEQSKPAETEEGRITPAREAGGDEEETEKPKPAEAEEEPTTPAGEPGGNEEETAERPKPAEAKEECTTPAEEAGGGDEEETAERPKPAEAEEEPTTPEEAGGDEEETEEKPKLAETEEADEFGDFEEDVVPKTAEGQLKVEPVGQLPLSPGWGAVQVDQNVDKDVDEKNLDTHSAAPVPSTVVPYVFDSKLLSELFPTPKATEELDKVPDDPIHCTSETRKAWYRLTRKQTMREYKSGLDDNYIRVTWKTSQVRSEANKVVSRWATEDRMAGRGPGARASFYWDTPVPKDQKTVFHPRHKPTAVPNPFGQSVQPLKTDAPAAFGWSSSATGADPWKDDATSTRSIPSPVIPKHIAVAKLQRQEGRGGSVDLTPRPQEPASHKRNAYSVDALNKPTPSISPILPPPPPSSRLSMNSMNDEANPWATLNALDTSTPPKPEPIVPKNEAAFENDDDDWGEMVESPAITTTQTPLPDSFFSEPPTRNNTISTPATTPKSVRSSPSPSRVTATSSKQASPIVRLRSTISPTSALFNLNGFVPTGVEEGLIGPGILKPRSASAESTSEKSSTPPRPVAQLDEVLQKGNKMGFESPKTKPQKETSVIEHDFSAFESSLPTPNPSSRNSLPPPAQTSSTLSSWADTADFSIFESPAPTPKAAARPPQQRYSAGPWSLFDTPAPEPFTRPPPRPITPPQIQPLTSATNSAQRRKMEEDGLIREIVNGLPDLRYMLRR
ncbi:hypothetical protein P280DRAFT_464871 [Massarina eburnea CBS 473.64]|uniref:Uncharacterized protein n=1 Tax=Massarina eburnea CBS 473.64 TaxID=1395130 RepID=A0A6A6SJW1_9PLEO|nr:hypothetical protein P280DRAFT_464871 [Massarina eburnea CBS 473.64]